MPFFDKKVCQNKCFFYVKTVIVRNNSLTNICDFSTRKHVIFCTFYQKYTFIYCKKIPSTCNRNLDLGYLVNPFTLFYDDKYSSNDKQRQVQWNIVYRTQLRLHFMQKIFIFVDRTLLKG